MGNLGQEDCTYPGFNTFSRNFNQMTKCPYFFQDRKFSHFSVFPEAVGTLYHAQYYNVIKKFVILATKIEKSIHSNFNIWRTLSLGTT